MPTRPRSVPPVPQTSRITRSSHTNSSSPSKGILAIHRSTTTTTTKPSSRSNDGTNASSSSSSSSSYLLSSASSLLANQTPPCSSSSSTTTTAATASSRLAAQADALAKMTLEMNLRSVSKQADRLERELRALVQSTAHDAAFRAQHEARLQDLWKEILAVKSHMGQDRDTRHMADEECRRETRRVMEEMRGELDGVRRMVGDISHTLSEMPSPGQMQAALSQSSSQGDSKSKLHEQQQQQQQPSSSSSTKPPPSIQERIREALKSTRRWNRDYKTTRRSDAVFCAHYLQQQSKRDASMAVFLQRAIQRRVQARFPGRRLRPQSLDDFCRVVRWDDVKGVVEDVLLRDTSDVVAALSK